MDAFIGGFILYKNIFIGSILDFYMNHLFSNNVYIVLNSTFLIKSCLVVNLLVISLFFAIANYHDLKFGIIPNKLSLILFVYGIIFNLFLAISSNNLFIIPFSIILTASVALISFILWLIGFWGGGDFKLFIGLSLALSFLDLNLPDYLNIDCFNNLNSIFLKNAINDLNLAISSQLILYPKVFSILLNGILIAFMFISLMFAFNILRNRQGRYYSIMAILDFRFILDQLTSQSIHIDGLSQGMVLDRYYFNDESIFDKINENKEDSNLNAFKDGTDFYFSSLNRIGLTEYDIEFINDMYKRGLIKNPYFKIKKGIPFIPFLSLGYLGFLIFGDFVYLISSFIKALF